MNIRSSSSVASIKDQVTPSENNQPQNMTREAVGQMSADTLDSAGVDSQVPKKTAFARMNEAWFDKGSKSTHDYFQAAPKDWHDYHDTFRDARSRWDKVPADEIIKTYRQETGLRIGDFGCGEGMIGAALGKQNTMFSFDHVAANDSIVACDIANVPLESATLDVAIFSLALMGNNFTSYIDEGHRTLRLGGTLHILEMSRRFTDVDGFLTGLEGKGFEISKVEDMWKFTHVIAKKSSVNLLSKDLLSF